ncbi:MAG: transposase, partial [Anaerocolumna sp.]|nr:transposase [Anaerocolumna sp.]
MANDNHLPSVTYTLYNVTTMKSYYNDFFEKGQLKIHFNLYQIGLPSDDPVYTLKKILEDLNYTSLLAQYSSKGRKGYNPIMMFAVLLYASMRGVRAVDRIVELCERDIAFIWLTNGLKPKRDAHTYISADRTDYNTLIPTLQKHEKVFAAYPKEVT